MIIKGACTWLEIGLGFGFGFGSAVRIANSGAAMNTCVMSEAHILNTIIKQVCTNGLVSFGLPIRETRGSIPRGTGPPFVAANWFDFHSLSTTAHHGGRVYYRSTTSESGNETNWLTTNLHILSFSEYPTRELVLT